MAEATGDPLAPQEEPPRLPGPAPGDGSDLVRRATTGDSVAITLLFREVTPAMARSVRGILGHGHPDVDDAMQQSMMALLRALPAFRGECSPAGYAATIAVRTALALRRRKKAERLRFDHEADGETMATLDPSPGEQAQAERRRKVLQELMAELPAEQAEALALRTVLGWSLEEIAENAGAPLNTIRSRLRLAKEALRRRIEMNPQLAEDLEVG